MQPAGVSCVPGVLGSLTLQVLPLETHIAVSWASFSWYRQLSSAHNWEPCLGPVSRSLHCNSGIAFAAFYSGIYMGGGALKKNKTDRMNLYLSIDPSINCLAIWEWLTGCGLARLAMLPLGGESKNSSSCSVQEAGCLTRSSVYLESRRSRI